MTTTMDNQVFVNDMFKQATENFNQAMNTGLKFQEESARFWGETFGKNVDQFRSQIDKISNESFPTAKKQLDRFHTMFDEQSKKGVEMFKEAFDSGNKAMNGDAYNQAMKMWRTSFDAMRSSVDNIAQANAEMFESFSSMTKNACCAMDTPAAKGNGKTAK
jgi:signal transduction protein with GAF and PtsI domain